MRHIHPNESSNSNRTDTKRARTFYRMVIESILRITRRKTEFKSGLTGSPLAILAIAELSVVVFLNSVSISEQAKSRFILDEVDNTIVLLLCGGDKSSQTRDIERARNYWIRNTMETAKMRKLMNMAQAI